MLAIEKTRLPSDSLDLIRRKNITWRLSAASIREQAIRMNDVMVAAIAHDWPLNACSLVHLLIFLQPCRSIVRVSLLKFMPSQRLQGELWIAWLRGNCVRP